MYDKHMGACMLSHFSHFRFFVTPWTAECQAPLSMGFPRQEYWSGVPFPSPGDLPHPGVHGPLAISSLNILEEMHSLGHQHNPTKLKYAF